MASTDTPEPVDPDLDPSDPAQPGAGPARGRPGSWRQHSQPGVLASLAAGGALGTGARDWIATTFHTAGGSFPWPTFWINISGSFLLGLGLILVLERLPPSRFVRPFFATGLCGGFTTFSTVMVEADLLVHYARPLVAATYLVATLLAGLAAAVAGVTWGRMLPLELAPLFGHRVRPRRRRFLR